MVLLELFHFEVGDYIVLFLLILNQKFLFTALDYLVVV